MGRLFHVYLMQISCEIYLKTLQSNNSTKTLQFYRLQWCSGEAMSQDFVKSAPILGDNPKAYFAGKSWISWNPVDFSEIWQISHEIHLKLVKTIDSSETLTFSWSFTWNQDFISNPLNAQIKSTVKSIMKSTLQSALQSSKILLDFMKSFEIS